MQIHQSRSLVINAPEFFQEPVFMAWLNNGRPKFSWHIPGNTAADEYSDVVVGVDPSLNGEGDSSDLPEHIWSQIVEACRQHIGPHASDSHYLVRLTNLET